MTEPRTAAGWALLDRHGTSKTIDVLAIEAEARAAALDETLAALRDDERLGDALHAAFHPGHPWSGCPTPDYVYTFYIPRFRDALAATPAEDES